MIAQIEKLSELKVTFEKLRLATENALIATIEEIIKEFLEENSYIDRFEWGCFYILDEGRERVLLRTEWPQELRDICHDWTYYFYQLEDDWWGLEIKL